MSKKEVFDSATINLSKHKYYHGSNVEIQGNYLYPRKAFNSVQNGFVSGAFVTSDQNFAKFFAINHCIAGEGQTKQIGNKIYLERLSNHIKPDFYVYTVYETPDKPFIHDRDTEYYSTEPIKIAETEKCDTAKEIEKLGFEIYVLNKPLKSKVGKEFGNNFAVQEEMAHAIEQKKFHRVDISKMIEQQSKHNKPKILYHGSQHKITDGMLHVKPAHTNHMQTETTAVFATSDFAHAKNYACMRLIAEGWKSPRTSDTLYVQKLRQDISGKKAYIYELDSDGFERDADGSYYSLTDKPIKKVIEIDVMQEIKNGNLKVYVLKEGLSCPLDRFDIWNKLVNNQDNFELYNPNSKNLDMTILAQMKDLGLNK